jgi:RNA polymerase sigma factor (sigma-70 family)
MPDQDRLAERFEIHRPHLRAVAYRMLGSVSDAEDVVQETWLRLARADAADIADLRAWLTTVASRVCLNMLRARRTRSEAPLEERLPDPIVAAAEGGDPEQEALLGDAVGLALQVVLDTLTPPERTAFVLHDVFGMPFDDIAPIVGKSAVATRQLASRARRRVREAPGPNASLDGQWAVVDAFIAASRAGDVEALVAILHPDVVLRSDGGTARPALTAQAQGAGVVATNALMFRQVASTATRMLVNGAAGVVAWTPAGKPFAVLAVTIRDGRIREIDVLADPDRLARLPLLAERPAAPRAVTAPTVTSRPSHGSPL